MKEASNFQVILRAMRISLYQVVVAIWALGNASAADSNGQALLSKKISINLNNKEVENVLQHIEKQISGKFVFSTKIIRGDRKINVSVKDQPLYKVLDETLKPLDLTYRVTENLIIISRTSKDGTQSLPAAKSKAPNFTVSGKIRDGKGETLGGVTVLLNYKSNGVVTDINGAFSFVDIPEGSYTLTISSIGFTSVKKEIQVIGGDLQVDVEMKERSAGWVERGGSEVVVVNENGSL